MPPTKLVYTVADVAKILELGKDRVLRLIHEGQLKAKNIASVNAERPQWRITDSALQDFLAT